MRIEKILLILILALFCLSLNLIKIDYLYKFSVLVITSNQNSIVPPYLKEEYLNSKLKWNTKLVLNESDIEKIRQINKNSINALENLVDVDFLILIELFTENYNARIHIYSFLHKIYIGNVHLKLDNSSFSINFLNLLYSLLSKISSNYEKKDFNRIIELSFKRLIDSNTNRVLYLVPSKVFSETLLFQLLSNYCSDENIQIYYQKLVDKNDYYKENILFNSVLYNIIEKIVKIILNKGYFSDIVIEQNLFKIVKEDDIKKAIADLLKLKLNPIEYELLSFMLFN